MSVEPLVFLGSPYANPLTPLGGLPGRVGPDDLANAFVYVFNSSPAVVDPTGCTSIKCCLHTTAAEYYKVWVVKLTPAGPVVEIRRGDVIREESTLSGRCPEGYFFAGWRLIAKNWRDTFLRAYRYQGRLFGYPDPWVEEYLRKDWRKWEGVCMYVSPEFGVHCPLAGTSWWSLMCPWPPCVGAVR